ncbi:iron-containing alcohol dehydrogenase family protein [Enterococcus sp. 669A]|uniref:Iron-containing alcohol dehydrogenase family protein n=1 Tax=Candidatus Enterococcus moelleringii TaxID=2815325 RepID=A0ABS3LFE9_9ENTE|nr:iron-containing alcohol dehydrogenase family protein [Enterococcus sp. 669A]MBO1307456.1 iron-containing alcohol dehydrogenase family protein [Enterococcus sp. 669A]
MNLATEVRPGANRYAVGQNILQDLPQYLEPFGKVAVVTGTISYQIFSDYYKKELEYPVFRYNGSASREDAQRIADEIGEADVILAIGGGRVLDTGKMVAEVMNIDAIMVPTLISNCAPFTPIVAVYHPDRTFREMGYMKKAPYLTLVDYDFLLATPKDYFVAGIGDTVAKWYEIKGITEQLPADEKTAYIRLGIASAKVILDILLEDSIQGIKDLENKQITPAFGRVADAIVGLAGETGGFAAAYGRSAGAHAVHDGLSYLESTHDQLHGNKVAYGILVQLAHTNEIDEIKKLQEFYQATGLPTKLSQLNVTATDADSLKPCTDHAACAEETFNMIDADITAEQVYQAIQVVESL